MKQPKNKLILLISITCIMLASCKKNDPVPAATDNTATLLQNKNWKLIAGTVTPAMSGITDWYTNFWDACERDDLYKFNATNVFILDEGATKCDPAGPQSQVGSWSYSTSTRILHFALAPPSDSYDLVITNISENSFTAKTVDVISGVSYTSTWTFTKQ